ncbi:MAG TPA: HD domain-containing protein [Rhizomicrobium sp.]|nr:HD domain-containing protein [Rhizomicrobium sp.]
MKRYWTAVMLLVLLGSAPASAQEAWRAKVTQFAADNFKHPAWGFSHSQRDYALAKSLAAADRVTLDDDVIFAAAYLHDMAVFDAWSVPKQEHGDTAAAKIDLVLADTDFPKAKLDAVRAAIKAHMYYRDAASPEARYLHDADALDWLGAIGVARLIALVDPKGGKPTAPDMLKAIQNNMKAVPPRVFTPAGKASVAPLLAEEKAFIDALARETDGFKTL